MTKPELFTLIKEYLAELIEEMQDDDFTMADAIDCLNEDIYQELGESLGGTND